MCQLCSRDHKLREDARERHLAIAREFVFTANSPAAELSPDEFWALLEKTGAVDESGKTWRLEFRAAVED